MRMYLLFLLVPLLCDGFSVAQSDIETVFGVPGKLPPPLPAVGQAVPVTPVPALNQGQAAAASPVNGVPQGLVPNSTELDLWDTMDEYIPSDADYDKFDLTLTKRVASRSGDNFMLSPLGLKLAMAILDEAATGATQRELDLVLDFDKDKTLVRNKFSRILDSLQTKSVEYILNLGSRIYVGKEAGVSQQFAAIALESYKTEISNLDFSQPKIACDSINAWVANNTAGRISDLVDEDDLADAILLVINTLFFKGTWRHQFVPNATKNDLFYVTPSISKETSFMTVKNKFYYAESERFSAKILRMPYLGNKFAMYIVVPNALVGLDHIFSDVTSLRSELSKLREQLVHVTLPKFQFEYTSLLDDTLKEMGIRQAFEDSASFPGISRGRHVPQRIKISKVLQRSAIEVNELGSVAYSATEISIVNKFGEDMASIAAEVVANRPFMFFIQDEVTKQLLFMGRLTDPTYLKGAYNKED